MKHLDRQTKRQTVRLTFGRQTGKRGWKNKRQVTVRWVARCVETDGYAADFNTYRHIKDILTEMLPKRRQEERNTEISVH
jgi:hypothetical protein